jgi:AcrR family transcriptional regulator
MDKAERRQQILIHARDVFAKRGYYAAKIDDIVAAAGIARGTFYLYFEDKRAIFEEIVDRVFARLGMTILRVDPNDAGRSVAEQIHENIRRIVTMLLEDRATTKIMLSDAVGIDAAFDRKLLSFYDEVATLLETSLKDGQKLGVVEEGDVKLYAYLTVGAMKELLYQVVMREWDYPEERIVDEIFVFLRRGFLRVDGEGASPRPRKLPKGGKAVAAAPPARTRIRTATPRRKLPQTT